MHTEITETIQGYVFYDATCPLCRRWMRRIYGQLVRRNFHPVPLQAKWARTRLGMVEGAPLIEMKLLTADGNIYGGADALVEIARAIWWLWPFSIFAQIPGAKALLRRTYLYLAARRACDDAICQIREETLRKYHHKTGSFFELP